MENALRTPALWTFAQRIAVVSAVIVFSVGAANAVDPPQFKTPQDCFAALQEAQATDDDAKLFACLSDYGRNYFLGVTMYHLEQHELSNASKRPEIKALLKQHGTEGIAVMGQMQFLKFDGMDPELAYANGGVWVTQPVEFLVKSRALLIESAKFLVSESEGNLAATKTKFAKQLVLAKSPAERAKITKESEEWLADIQATLDRAKLDLQIQQPPPQSKKATLINLTIDGETAKGEAKREGETGQPILFSKVGDGWRIALLLPEPKVAVPTAEQRREFRLEVISSVHKILSEPEPCPWTVVVERYAKFFSDDDLAIVASFDRIEELSLENTEKVSDEGFKKLLTMKKLKSLRLLNLPVSTESLALLAQLTGLRKLELENMDVADETIALLRRSLPNCEVIEAYSLWTCETAAGRFSDSRDLARVCLHVVGEGEKLPFYPQDKTVFHPSLKSLIRIIREEKVQVIDNVFHFQREKYDWTKEFPWFKSQELPQFAFFLPGEEKPAVILGDVSAEKLSETLLELVKKARAAAPKPKGNEAPIR